MHIADPSGAFFGTSAHRDAERRSGKIFDPDSGYIVLHPGAAVPARMWPRENSAAAVQLLAEQGYTVVVTGGPAERELTASVAGEHGIDLGGVTNLVGTAEVLKDADVVISGNTGPAHLSAAVGTPVVSLYSPVIPAARWAPYGVPIEILGDQNAPCRDSRARECPIPGHPCLASVGPQEVLEAMERLLRNPPESRAFAPRLSKPTASQLPDRQRLASQSDHPSSERSTR